MKSDWKKKRYFIDTHNNGLLSIHYHHNNKDLIVLPSEHRKAFANYYHYNMFTGIHSNAKAMAKELIKYYYWPGYWQDLKDYVQTCHNCQINKATKSKKVGKLKTFTPDRCHQMINIDHKGPLPITIRGNKYITSIIDRFSGKVYPYAVQKIDAKTTAITLVQHMCRYGVAESILSDKGSDLMSETVEYVCKMSGIKKLNATAWFPEGNGGIERWQRTLGTALRCISMDKDLDFTDGDS